MAVRTINYKSQFKKSLKKHGNEIDLKELTDCIDKISKGESLPQKYKDHKLRKPWKNHPKADYREFHITNRLCVVYLILKDSIEIYDIGTHKELNLAESLMR